MNWGFYSMEIIPVVGFHGRKVNAFIILIDVAVLLSKKAITLHTHRSALECFFLLYTCYLVLQIFSIVRNLISRKRYFMVLYLHLPQVLVNLNLFPLWTILSEFFIHISIELSCLLKSHMYNLWASSFV